MLAILFYAITIYLVVKAAKAGWLKRALLIAVGNWLAQFMLGFFVASYAMEVHGYLPKSLEVGAYFICACMTVGHWIWLGYLKKHPRKIPTLVAEIAGAIEHPEDKLEEEKDVILLTDRIN